MSKKENTVIFGAVGDISFYRQIAEDVLTYGAGWPFRKMLPFLGKADLLFGNMESVVIPKSFPENKIDPEGLISKLPGPFAASILKAAGFDFLNMAANHVLDAGSIGMNYTKKCLEDAGIVTGGVGTTQQEARRLKILKKNGISFGFLCYGEDSNYTLGHTGPCYAYYEIDTILEDVKKNKGKVDILVVSLHADLEFMPTPSVPRRDNSRRIAAAGAKIILQHHPHVPQGIEMIKGCLIAYSLGNFLFDAHTSNYMKRNGPYTAYSSLLLMKVGKKGVRSFERIPYKINEVPEQRPSPLFGAENSKMLRYLSKLDKLLKDNEFVKRTWSAIAKKHLLMYLNQAKEQNIDRIINEVVGRLCLVAENREWMNEILLMAKERWDIQKKAGDPYHRPNYKYQER